MIALRCTWRTCRNPGPWTITAGKAGSGNYAQAGACDTHIGHVERRTRRYANGQPATIKRLELEPDHPHINPHDGRPQCDICGKFVWSVLHSCKGARVAPIDPQAEHFNPGPSLLTLWQDGQ